MAKSKYTGVERRHRDRRSSVQTNGRRKDECALHAAMIEQSKNHGSRIGISENKFDNYVTWKMISLIFGFSLIVVASGFKYFSDDLGKTKESQVEMIRHAAAQAEKTAISISTIQREIVAAIADNQRENRAQFDRMAGRDEQTSKIQAVVLNEIAEIKKRNERIDNSETRRRP